MAKKKPVDDATEAAFPDADPTPEPEPELELVAEPLAAPEPTPAESVIAEADALFAVQAAGQTVSPGDVQRVLRTAVALLRG